MATTTATTTKTAKAEASAGLAVKLDASIAASPNDLASWGDAGQDLLDGVVTATNEPHESRQLRGFRKTEAMEIGGFDAKAWRIWREEAGATPQHQQVTLAEIHARQERLGIRPSRPKGARPFRLALTNQKGGASKTTTTLHLAHYLAFRGYRTLVIDLDPQGTCTRYMAFTPEAIDARHTMLPVFRGHSRDGLIEPLVTHIDGLSLIAASLEMAGADISMAASFLSGREDSKSFYRLLHDALTLLEEPYDIILIDTPPAFSFAAVNVMYASDGLLIPVPASVPDFSATIDALGMMGETMEQIAKRAGFEKKWDFVAFLHTRVDPNSKTADAIRDLAYRLWGSHRIDAFVPESRAYQHAMGIFRSIYEVTSAEVDSRPVARARVAFDAVGKRVEQLILDAWEKGATA